jgi:hypothetical protein
VLIYFPRPYPDELLYSVCARYHYYACNYSCKDTTEELFGKKTACAVVDLPGHLQYLCDQLPTGSSLTPDKIIIEHTIFPMFQPFLPIKRVGKLIEAMKSPNKGGSIHNTIGVMASGVSAPKYLRYCQKCYEEDEKFFGEAYWHRVHQVSGVKICPRHGIWLEETEVHANSSENKHRFHLLQLPLLSCSLKTKDFAEYYPFYLKIAVSLDWLLFNEINPSKLSEIRKRYLAYLELTGLAANGRLHQRDLLKEFNDFFTKKFLESLNCRVDQSEDNWLNRLLRKPRNTIHPLRHILLMMFLGITPEKFFNEKVEKPLPFGPGPWPCLNPVSGHYRKLMIRTIEITQDSKLKCPVGHFQCLCGFHYSRRGPDQLESDIYRIGRIQCFGLIWEKELMKLINDKEKSIREIANHLNVDPKTVINQVTRLDKGMSFNKTDLNEAKRKNYRNRWLCAINENDHLSRSEVRGLVPSIYTWLYKNDRDWLMASSPTQKSSILPKNNRVDWFQRDLELHEKVAKIITIIKNFENYKYTRITASLIGREIDELMIIQKHLDKLPMTCGLLNTITESKAQFRTRRIQNAISEIMDQGLDLMPWRIAREANIRPEYMSMVFDELNLYFNKGDVFV